VSDALDRLLDEIGGSDKDLALTLYAMATGRKNLIGDRKPEFMWFQALMERVEGKVTEPVAIDDRRDGVRAVRELLNDDEPSHPAAPAKQSKGKGKPRSPGKASRRKRGG